MALPVGILQPGQVWTASRRLTVDTLLFASTGTANVTYKYLGVRDLDGQTVAAISMAGTISPANPVATLTGKLRGTMLVDVKTGRALRGKVTVDANIDIREVRRGRRTTTTTSGGIHSSGTLECLVTRSTAGTPVGPPPPPLGPSPLPVGPIGPSPVGPSTPSDRPVEIASGGPTRTRVFGGAYGKDPFRDAAPTGALLVGLRGGCGQILRYRYRSLNPGSLPGGRNGNARRNMARTSRESPG